MVIVITNAMAETKYELKVGSLAPDFVLKDSAGQEHNLKGYLDKKIVYLVFFTTWCGVCKKEMPELNKIYQEYKKQGLEMLGINVMEESERVAKFIKDQKIEYTVLLDTKAVISKAYQLKRFPLNIIIDDKGIIRFIGSTPPKDFDRLFKEIKPVIKEKERK